MLCIYSLFKEISGRKRACFIFLIFINKAVLTISFAKTFLCTMENSLAFFKCAKNDNCNLKQMYKILKD